MTALLQAAPVPPVPPLPPVAPLPPLAQAPPDAMDVIVRTPNGPFDMLPPPVFFMLALASLVAVTVVVWPLVRAIARRIERGPAGAAADRAELEELRHRVADLEERQGRMLELEERLDFAERLLAERGREAERLGRGEV